MPAPQLFQPRNYDRPVMNTFVRHKRQIQSNNKTVKYEKVKKEKRNDTIKTTTYSNIQNTNTKITRMWANAQPDGRPAEHRWRPLFNAAKFG